MQNSSKVPKGDCGEWQRSWRFVSVAFNVCPV